MDLVSEINVYIRSIVLYCTVLYCIMRPYTDGPIGPLSHRHTIHTYTHINIDLKNDGDGDGPNT